MTTKSKFYYPVTVIQGTAEFPVSAPYVDTLPLTIDEPVVILDMSLGDQDQGLYVYDGAMWRFALSIQAVSAAIIRGEALSFYVYPTTSAAIDPTAQVYKNGILTTETSVTPGRAIYCIAVPPAGGGGSGYVLPVASMSTLGGVKQGAGVNIDGAGVLSVPAPSFATTTTPGVVSVGTGLEVTAGGVLSAVATPIASGAVAGIVRVGTGLAIDGSGILSVTASAGAVASVNAKTGAVVIAAGSGITVDNTGANVVVNLALTGALVNTALGYTPYDGSTNPNGYQTTNAAITLSGDATGTGATGIAVTLAASGVPAGTYKSVTVDAKGRVTAGTNPTTLAEYGITDALSTATGGNVSGNLTFVSGAKVTGLPTPTVASDAATKDYVDQQVTAIATGVSWKQNVRAASTGPLALTAIQSVDGVSLAAGDRVLYKDATDQTLNGVYVVAAGAWTRATDVDTGAEIQGMAVLVIAGTTNALTQWVNTNSGTITIGTTNITYTQLNAQGATYTAGTGLTLTGTVFSITPSGVTAGTYAKVTVNASGQVTVGAQLAASDITTALAYTPVNRAGDTMTGALNWNTSATLASAATTSIGAAASNSINVTGTTAITSFGASTSGALRLLNFAGILTLTYNATSLILPTAANITTQAGDSALFVSLGGSNWKCVSYLRADGTALSGSAASDPTKLSLTGGTMSGALNYAPSVTVASATSTAIGAAASNTVNVTGTTTITSFDTIAAGARRTLVFAAALTLTHNATSLVLPTSANIVTAAGDVAEMLSLGGGNWKCVDYVRQSGAPLVTTSTFTTTQRFVGSTSQPAIALTNAVELVNVVAAAPAATQNIYLASGAVQFFTGAASANWVVNFAFSAGTALNTAMAIGDSMTVAMATTQGATAFLPSSYTIDGTAVSPRWQGGTAPTAGNASGNDVYTFTIIKTAANTYTVWAAQTQYK